MTYALREARHAAPGELSAQRAARARPECPQRTECAGLRSTTRSTAPASPQ